MLTHRQTDTRRRVLYTCGLNRKYNNVASFHQTETSETGQSAGHSYLLGLIDL